MSSVPTHGKWADLYRLRPNGFSGDGLNDVTWGTAFNGAASAYYEVVIDAEDTPDTFKWRKNGGDWTTGVAITGGAQTLDEAQTITFATTTGHTLNDQWVIGNLKDEPCTEDGLTGQITDATKRILNPFNLPTFADSGSEVVTHIDPVRGLATFGGNVTAVTVDGNNAFVVKSGLQQVGYLIGWDMNYEIEMGDAARCQQHWKEFIPGQGSGSGNANAFFIGADSWFDTMEDELGKVQEQHFLELFTYEPSADQAGDHFNVWATMAGLSISTALNVLIQENLSFTLQGAPLLS